eukprot:3343154-Prymnesium_polylepis.1
MLPRMVVSMSGVIVAIACEASVASRRWRTARGPRWVCMSLAIEPAHSESSCSACTAAFSHSGLGV